MSWLKWTMQKQGDPKLLEAVYDLTRADRLEASAPRHELTAPTRKAFLQLLGRRPEHKLHDFIKHGRRTS